MKLIGLIVSISLALATTVAFAQQIAEPDDLLIDEARAFGDLLEDGDMLVTVYYNIEYDSLPVLAAPDTFVVRFMRGNSELNASEIFAFNDAGYGLGIAGMYFSAADMSNNSIEYDDPNEENYAVWLQGKPSAWADPPLVTLFISKYASTANSKNLLSAHILDIGTELGLDANWVAGGATPLVEHAAGQTVLTRNGEDYFAQAIPNLNIMTPDIFRSSTNSPAVFEREFGFSERDNNNAFWDGTSIGDGIASVATLFRVDNVLVAGVIGLIMVGFFVWLAQRISGNPEFGIASLGFLYPLVTVIGLGSMTALMLVGALAILGIGFSLFLRRAG